MHAAILLCATILATDNPAQVQAKVLYGTDARDEQRADIELWISKAVAKAGSPLARPYTSWIALANDSRRLYTPKEGSFYIDGKAIERCGNYQVEIDGCDGEPLDKTVVLRPGERQVVKLTDYPAPDNLFVALEAPLSDKTKRRVEAMKANAKALRLELNYHGEQDKPFYGLIVSVPPVALYPNRPFLRIMFVKEDEAIRIIDHLARNGFFDHAIDLRSNIKIPAPSMPGYSMKRIAGDISLYEDLAWGLPMIHRLDALREVLPDNGMKEMDLLLGRLSGLRAQWEAEHPSFQVEVGREDSRISFTKEDDKTIIDVSSEFGIDKATIRRRADEWTRPMILRLHLSGLEAFKASSGNVAVEWSVSSTGDHATRTSLVSGKRVAAIPKDSPYFSRVRIVGGNGKIPLKGGFFEVALPAKLFERNPDEITLKWIDFYRR